jgi:capsid protein
LVLDQNRKVVDGVEIGDRGQIIGFHVKKPNTLGEFEFIKARDSKGRKMAYLVYATKMRIDDVRGVPIITPVLETLKMLDRYKNATVGGAEERQKIALFIEHDKDSTGENPLLDNVKRSLNTTGNNDKHTQDYLQEIQEIQGQIAITQQKQAINLTNGSTIKSIQSDQEINFKDFFLTNVNIICACIGIPPEIALSKYDSNFSASRAAIKDWEHTLNVVRKNFSEQFYQPIYELWLDLMILQGKIDEKNYFNALMNEDDDILGAFRNCRWTGASVPHIDPLKEVQAERLKLGDLGANIPLTTAEKATENVNGGESNSNIEQFLKEIAKIPNPEPKNVANNEK